MKYLHTMVRIHNIDESLAFYCDGLGLVEVKRRDSQTGRYTLIFLATDSDVHQGGSVPMIELTYNWDPEIYTSGRNFGHLAFEVDNIYAICDRLICKGITIHRPPRDGRMAFVKSPDGISVELLQHGPALPPQSPWDTMPNDGEW